MILWPVLGGIAATIAVIDARTQKIPYRLSVPLFALTAWLGSPVNGLALLAVTMAVSLLMRGLKRPAFGDGDAMLVGAAGCLVDWRLAVLAAAVPSVLALTLSRGQPVALGPWIVGGEAVAMGTLL